MSKRFSQKQIMRELKKITASIPEELLTHLMKKETIAPTMFQLIQKAVDLPNGEKGMDDEKRKHFQNIIDSGVLDRQVDVLDKDGESAIEKYIEAELALAVKLGRLPKEAPMPGFIRKKGLKYARKQRSRLKDLYAGEVDPKGDDAAHDPKDEGRDRATGHPDSVVSPSSGESR